MLNFAGFFKYISGFQPFAIRLVRPTNEKNLSFRVLIQTHAVFSLLTLGSVIGTLAENAAKGKQ